MSKKAFPRRLSETEAKAAVRTIQTTPRKVNLLAGLIRGKSAQAAKAELAFSRRRVAGEVLKALDSAIANAENNHQLDVDKLYVAEASVGPGLHPQALPRPRARPRRQGREDVEQSDDRCARARGDRLMGQKTNPIGFRVGINRTWDSRWFAKRDYAGLLHEDLRLRKYLMDRLGQAGISRVVIERPAKRRASPFTPRVRASSSARRARISRSCARTSRR